MFSRWSILYVECRDNPDTVKVQYIIAIQRTAAGIPLYLHPVYTTTRD